MCRNIGWFEETHKEDRAHRDEGSSAGSGIVGRWEFIAWTYVGSTESMDGGKYIKEVWVGFHYRVLGMRRDLFSGSLEVVIRTDGRHWNPLMANRSFPMATRLQLSSSSLFYFIYVPPLSILLNLASLRSSSLPLSYFALPYHVYHVKHYELCGLCFRHTKLF